MGNSADRRRERRALERKSRSERILWSLAGAMAIIIVFVNRTPAWTVLLLLTLWVLLVLAALDLQVVRLAKAGTSRNLSRTAAVLLVTVVVVVFGVYNWPSSGLGELTSAERDNFKATLKTQNEPILIHLMCPPNDERDCTVAS